MAMIGRPILFHNEYVPAIIGRREYKYLVLGHHDGMTVGKAFVIDPKESFGRVFVFNVESEGQKSDYSTQFFYGFHEEDVNEQLFWESSFPFTFISFLQFDNTEIGKNQRYLESQQYKEDEWEALGLTECRENIKVIAYYALDSSDIILAIKCNQCDTGTQMINNLHQDICNRHCFNIRNSYSVLAIDREYIENCSQNRLAEERVDWMELRIIERKNGSINGLYNELRTALAGRDAKTIVERKGLMGTEDEAILIKNVLWTDLLSLYKEESGILKNSNACSQQYASAITAKMLYSIKAAEMNEEQKIRHSNIGTPFCEYLYRKIEMIYDGEHTESALSERKNLVMLVNALRKIEYSNSVGKNFNDYCFFTIMLPAAMFVRLREKEDNNAAEFYEFIKYIKLCMQNFTKPDRVYQQITDFNIRYFDSPSKLLALCNAYLYYAKQTLNVDSNGEYEFLLCPGMNMKTEVRELYQGTDHKTNIDKLGAGVKGHHLFRVEIPEAHIYNLPLMFFTLGHEVSHFVGRVIRKREARYESILKLVSMMTAISLKMLIGFVNEFADACFDEKIWSNIEVGIYKLVRHHIEGHMRLDYMKSIEYDPCGNSDDTIKNQINYYKLFFRHTSTLKILLKKVVANILHSEKEKLFSELVWRDISEAIENKDLDYADSEEYYKKQMRQIAKCIEAFVDTNVIDTDSLVLSAGIENIMYLLEECYADMSCILLLRLSLKDYLTNIVKIIETTGCKAEDLAETKIITRIAIVMAVMSYEGKGPGVFRWTDDEILKSDGEDKEVLNLQEEAFLFIQAYMHNKVELTPRGATESIQIINLDYQVLREIMRYLLMCREEYSHRVIQEMEIKVRRFYELTKESDPNDFFETSTKILKEYEEDIYNEMQKLKESEERS